MNISKFKKLGVFLVVILFSLSIVGCNSSGNDINMNTLTVGMEGEGKVLNENNEKIVSSKNKTSEIKVENGSMVELSAEPAEDWVFVNWKGTDNSSKETTIYVTENKTVKALFGTVDITNVTYEKDSLDQWVFEGLAENIMRNELDYVEIYVYLYDENDVRVGSGWTNETDIPNGEKFEWKVYIDSGSDFDYYEVKLKDL